MYALVLSLSLTPAALPQCTVCLPQVTVFSACPCNCPCVAGHPCPCGDACRCPTCPGKVRQRMPAAPAAPVYYPLPAGQVVAPWVGSYDPYGRWQVQPRMICGPGGCRQVYP